MKNSMQILLVILVAVAASVGAGIFAPETAGTPLGHVLSFLGAGGLTASFCLLFGSKPEPSRFVTPRKNATDKTSNAGRFVRPAPKVTTTTGEPLAANALTAPASTATEFKVDSGTGGSLLVTSAPQEDGSVAITVKVVGYTGSQFKNRIRNRLENVRGVSWKNPVNEHNGTRRVEGTIGAAGAAAALKAISTIR